MAFGSNNPESSTKKPPVPVMVAGAVIGLLGVVKLAGKLRGGGTKAKSHFHDAVTHDHVHVHVTHNRSDPDKGVGGWEHLTAEHSHPHNHASQEHSHRPHRNFDAEHRREAHVHDHEHPIGP